MPTSDCSTTGAGENRCGEDEEDRHVDPDEVGDAPGGDDLKSPPLLAAAGRLILDPLEIGAIRLVGVSYSGLSAVQQFSMFPELDEMDAAADAPAVATAWR